jgi:hypothetical protein
MTLPERANYSLTESALSPFPAEPAQRQIAVIPCATTISSAGVRGFVIENRFCSSRYFLSIL